MCNAILHVLDNSAHVLKNGLHVLVKSAHVLKNSMCWWIQHVMVLFPLNYVCLVFAELASPCAASSTQVHPVKIGHVLVYSLVWQEIVFYARQTCKKQGHLLKQNFIMTITPIDNSCMLLLFNLSVNPIIFWCWCWSLFRIICFWNRVCIAPFLQGIMFKDDVLLKSIHHV